MFNPNYFSRVLKSKRAMLGWSQEDLAKKTGISINAISRYEAGSNVPLFENVCLIAEALNCGTDDFWVRQ